MYRCLCYCVKHTNNDCCFNCLERLTCGSRCQWYGKEECERRLKVQTIEEDKRFCMDPKCDMCNREKKGDPDNDGLLEQV